MPTYMVKLKVKNCKQEFKKGAGKGVLWSGMMDVPDDMDADKGCELILDLVHNQLKEVIESEVIEVQTNSLVVVDGGLEKALEEKKDG